MDKILAATASMHPAHVFMHVYVHVCTCTYMYMYMFCVGTDKSLAALGRTLLIL